MKLIYIVLFLGILFSNLGKAQSIVVVDVQDLIDNNKIYQEPNKVLVIKQAKYIKEFEKKEQEIQ